MSAVLVGRPWMMLSVTVRVSTFPSLMAQIGPRMLRSTVSLRMIPWTHSRVGANSRPSAPIAKAPGGELAAAGLAIPGSSVQQVTVTHWKLPRNMTSPPLTNKPSRTRQFSVPFPPSKTQGSVEPPTPRGRRMSGRCSFSELSVREPWTRTSLMSS